MYLKINDITKIKVLCIAKYHPIDISLQCQLDKTISKTINAMKTTLIPYAALAMVVAVFTSIQVNAAMTSNQQKVKAALYENSWIPSIQLKEVEISANGSQARVYETSMYQGQLIPFVQLNEVTIKASGNYTPSDIPAFAFRSPEGKGHKVDVVQVNGQYIPSIQLAEVTVVAERSNAKSTVGVASGRNSEKSGHFQVNTRQTFNVLITYVVEKGINILRHMVPVSVQE
ncbi:MAG: hypothetical protein JNL88_01215 [Bacteroidia bacterium]|nr:hypothetical protein [Bacteroidia bacterium]